MSDPVPTEYQRYTAAGAESRSFAGVELVLKPGDDADADAATWLLPVGALGGLTPRADTDYLRTTDGTWWSVGGVGEPIDGMYPLACARWDDEEGG